MNASATGLNEWGFDLDAAGLTLSQTTNSGTQTAAFSGGGDGFLETDGNGCLVCTRTAAGTNEMWTGGAILDADVPDAGSGVHYLRVDCNYDLTSTNRVSGMAVGVSVLDESGSNVAGMVIGMGSKTAPLNSEIKDVFFLPLAGRLSAILKIDMDAGTMTAWYNVGTDESFDESTPAASDIPIQLTSIDKLRFQATGDVRPSGSSDFAAADHIRTASTWEEITLPASLPLTVHPLFQDNMVLQRDMDTPVWGGATPDTEVTVHLDGVPVGTAVADERGKWMAGIGSHAHDGGQAHVLEVSTGTQSIQFDEVVFGDVYLASGQSNMQMPMKGWSDGPASGYLDELAVADSFPLIRHVAVSYESSTNVWEEPLLRINWNKCSSATMPYYSAVGYFFAKNLYETTGVPVGLLLAAYGGQRIERFISPSGLAAVPELAGMFQYQEEGGVAYLYDIYNAMIAPLIPYGIKGAIWYQGEANGEDGNIYKYKMQALARGWRQNWGQGDFPFYYVQIAAYNTDADWPGLRASQTAALSETNFGMAVTIDIGDYSNIHPPNKADAGRRLAQWALAADYGQDRIRSGPLYRSSVIEGSQIRILFDYADGRLIAGQKDGTNDVVEISGPLQNFEVAGADKIFVEADAVIDRDTVLVSSAAVPDPVYVRYCWESFPSGSNNLYNASGLPLSPFSTADSYILDVVSGSGSAAGLIPGAQQNITADSPVSGKIFDRWIGAASEIADPNASSTTITMPKHSLYLLATYRDLSVPVYTTTVNNGYGSGTSQAGSVINIEAAIPAGQKFDHWSGDTQTVINVSAACTTLRMPDCNIDLTAVCRPADSVGDGISNEWRAAYFGGDGFSTNAQSAANADPDGDGMSNEQEFYAGTSPVNALSKLNLAGSFSSPDASVLFSSVAGRRYQLQRSRTLSPPAWETALYNITGDGKQKTLLLDLNDQTAGFYRLEMN